MRFLIMVKNSGSSLAASEGGAQPDLEAVQAMMKFNEELVAAGAFISAEGLHPSAKAARISFAKGKQPKVTDGPFTEAKELVGGYWIARFATKQAAIDFVSRCPLPDGEIEIREIFDIGDRPDDIKAVGLEFAEKLGKQK
jgi:hypothetical protein